MHYLETILSFIIKLARVFVGRKKKKEPEECRCDLSDDPEHSFTDDEPDGSDIGCTRNATVSLQREAHEINPVNVMGWCLILASVF